MTIYRNFGIPREKKLLDDRLPFFARFILNALKNNIVMKFCKSRHNYIQAVTVDAYN